MPFAININAFQAEDIKNLPDDTVMVSINNEYEELFPLNLDRNSPKVCTLQFADINDIVYRNGNPYHPISDEDTYKALKFVNANKDKNFVVHCAAGISRSAGFCLYLHLMHGHILKDNFWKVSHPNAMVLGKLMMFKGKYGDIV